jgi:hypothetical protein
MKDALLLLQELPSMEVGEAFDDAVWQKLRSSGPQSVRRALRERVRGFAQQISFTLPFWKWSPVFVGAALLMVLAVGTEPPSTFFAGSPPAKKHGEGEPAKLNPSAPEREGSFALLDVSLFRQASSASESEETLAEMPEAVEAYLRNARELRLPSDSDRLRRSNYAYPLPRVPDPARSPGAEDSNMRLVGSETAVIAF